MRRIGKRHHRVQGMKEERRSIPFELVVVVQGQGKIEEDSRVGNAEWRWSGTNTKKNRVMLMSYKIMLNPYWMDDILDRPRRDLYTLG